MLKKVFYGDDMVTVNLPDETRVLSALDPLEALTDYERSVRYALSSPLGCPPLREQVGPRSRVTIAFDDPCLPLRGTQPHVPSGRFLLPTNRLTP